MKNINKKIIITFFVLIILLVLSLFLVYKKTNNVNNENLMQGENLNNTEKVLRKDEGIIIEFPKDNEKISSPLKISGQARGYWFFEAQFTAELYDESNNLLGQAILTAEDEWMTENFVPFKGELVFSNSNTKKGILKFLSANPSGEEENQKIFELLVNF